MSEKPADKKTYVKHVMNTSKISGSDGRSGKPEDRLKAGIENGNADWWNKDDNKIIAESPLKKVKV